MVGIDPWPATTGPLEWAESTDRATGPAPKLTPATTDKAAAAAAPDAMKRLRPKESLDAANAAEGMVGLGGAGGSGCPNERDVNTSSKVACSLASAHSGFDAPMLLHVRLSGR